MIEVEGIGKDFGRHRAVDELTFNARPGEVLGLLGPNGAGKTTTMRMITGYMRPCRGRVVIHGHELWRNPRRAKRLLGYLPEGAPSYEEMTPLSFLRFVAGVRGLKGAHRRQRIDAVVGELALESVLNKPIETLSKGYRRRVGLAQALVHDPALLVLDEPTDGLDPNQKRQVRELIERIAPNKIILISTHILEEVSALCSRVLLMDQGRMVADGSPGALESRSRYHGAVTLKLVEADGANANLLALPGVSAVEPDREEQGRVTVFPESGSSIVLPVTELINRRGWKITELRTESGRLEEVFHSLTGAEEQRLRA